MKRSMKKAIIQHSEQQSLSQAQLSALQALKESKKRPNSLRHYYLAGTLAASLVVLALLLVFIQPVTQKDLVHEIAAEVVQNHLHLKPLEVVSPDLDDLRNYFNRLDFRPVESRYLQETGLQLAGGRYCSLQGITAAQLRFTKMGSDQLHTLYQVSYDPEVFQKLPLYDQGEAPVSTFVNGIKVTLWVEKGILFALTED